MLDIDANNIKILPADHIALKDYDYAVSVAKQNQMFQKVMYGILVVGILALGYYVSKRTKEDLDKQKEEYERRKEN
jgi:hypothetical protein